MKMIQLSKINNTDQELKAHGHFSIQGDHKKSKIMGCIIKGPCLPFLRKTLRKRIVLLV